MAKSYRRVLLDHLNAEMYRLDSARINAQFEAVAAGFEEAFASGVPAPEWVVSAASQLQADLDQRRPQQARLLAELDRWIEFRFRDSPLGRN